MTHLPALKRAVAWILVAAAPARALWFIHRYAVDVPAWDDWAYVKLAWQLPSAADLWAPHNEHRVPLPKLAMLGMHRATALDERAGMYASWLCLLGMLAILYVQFRRTGQGLVLFAPVSFILFTQRQYENLLWGQGIIIALGALCTVATFALLDGERPRIGRAVMCAAAGSLSFASCLLIWPTGAAQLAMRASLSREGSRRDLWIWIASGVVATALYLHGWVYPRYHPPPARELEVVLMYFFAAFGASLSPDPTTAAATGVILLAAAVVVFASVSRSGLLHPHRLMPAALVVFCVFQAGLLTVGRSGFGPGQAVASRYATFALLGVIGAWLLAAETPQPTRWGAACAGAIAALAIVGVLVGLRDGTVHGVATWSDRLRQANVLATWRVQPDSALRTLFPSAEYVRAFAPELERRRLSVFRAESR